MTKEKNKNLQDYTHIFSPEEIRERKDKLKAEWRTKFEANVKAKKERIEERKYREDMGMARIIIGENIPAISVLTENPEPKPTIKEKIIKKIKKPDIIPEVEAVEEIIKEVEKEIVEIVIPPEPEVPEEIPKINGKKTCPICGKEFAPQGFNSHLKACLKNAEEMEAGEE